MVGINPTLTNVGAPAAAPAPAAAAKASTTISQDPKPTVDLKALSAKV